MEFQKFKEAVDRQFTKMAGKPLYVTAVDKDEMWDHYLQSFPEGSNPIFRERTEHDCSCCKQFVRNMGNVVSIAENGSLTSIWDCKVGEKAYQVVADAMSALVKSKAIQNQFLHYEKAVGTDHNFEQVGEEARRWDHFFLKLPQTTFCKKDDIGTKLGAIKAKHDVFARGLRELTLESVETVLELIAQGSLYRGEEHQFALSKFKLAKKLFIKSGEHDNFPWFFMDIPTPATAGIRNTSIGQLLINLSDGMDLEQAVGKFEAMVAPTNYKRPTALITKGMIDKAKKAVDELGYTTALDRRFATIEDITINNVLFADRSVRSNMAEASPFDDLTGAKAISDKELRKVEEVPIDVFIETILPKAETIEVLVENRLKGNLMSLIAPVDPDAKKMFKWDNNFTWSYNGEVADSMKERVKQAGGDVTGDLRFSIQWNDEDVHNNCDYDAHCVMPNGRTIYYSNMRHPQVGGKLDVDRTSTKKGVPAVENITFESRHKMPVGDYAFKVHNYRSDRGDTGFRAQIEFDGVIHEFSYPKKLRQDEKVAVATVHWDGTSFTMKSHLDSSASTQEVWGMTTQQFVKLETLMYSPNYWDDRCQGNKHHFFILADCLNPEDSRGFYNEFLDEKLSEHRKVFEVLGSKMRAAHTDRQLSGLGFSSTQRNHVFCKIAGNFTRTIKVCF